MDSSAAELRAFYATAKLGSMVVAGRSLGLTQPTISAHIAALEHRYGVELFFRRGRRVDLTDFGHSLFETTQRMFRAEEDAHLLLQQAHNQFSGLLKICAVGPYNVTPLIGRFREKWPAVKIAVSISDSREIMRRILNYEGDVGLPLHPADNPKLISIPYQQQRLVVFASIHHPLAAQSTIQWSDLEGQEFVMREEGSTTRLVFEQALAAQGVRTRCSIEMGSRESVREAVMRGLGLGVVAETAYLPDARLKALPFRDQAPKTHPHVVYLSERQQARVIQNFLSVLHPPADATTALPQNTT